MKFGLPPHILQKITEVLTHFPEVEEALVYGSRAKGNYREGSDIDLTLKGAALTSKQETAIWLALDNLNMPWTIDLSVFHLLKSSDLEAHIERVGQVLYAAKISV